jgi:hypothetical protein
MNDSMASGMTGSDELRSLTDEEILAVAGGKGPRDGVPVDLPAPPPTTGGGAGIYLFPLVYSGKPTTTIKQN